MGRVDYSGRADAYQRARTLPPAVLDAWTATIATLPLPPAARVLDLGAGPGTFVDALTAWTGARVVAVEPSESMRERAVASGASSRHPYVAGVAERIPLRDASVDWAWLSTVVHQFDDLGRAAHELARVIRPGGCVLVRGLLADVTVTGLLAEFPGIERAARSFPATAAVVEAFRTAGIALDASIDVVEPWTFDLEVWTAGIDSVRDSDSLLRRLTDDEFDEGVHRVTTTAAPGEPLRSDLTLRLLVLRR